MKQRIANFIKKFLDVESSAGILLMLVATLAMVVANSGYAPYYETFKSSTGHTINDGLMVLFFLLIGLEIKRELVAGELSTPAQALLPGIAALGGVLTPALIYSYFNWGSGAMRGWAIPTATDIAFSLGVLSLFGNRVNPALKIFLMAVAVFDDLVAVLIIAVFYTHHLAPGALSAAALCVAGLVALNKKGITRMWPYLLLGACLWWTIYKSGVHATIAGVILGLTIPLRQTQNGESLAETMIRRLHPWVAFGIVPLFAFANAGVPLKEVSMADLTHPLPLGIMLGLFIGKQLGITLFTWLAIRLNIAPMPTGARWSEIYAISVIAGIGFTMSLFIGTLAFASSSDQAYVRLGVLLGSLLSVILGVIILAFLYRMRHTPRK